MGGSARRGPKGEGMGEGPLEFFSALNSHEYIDIMTGMINDVFTSVNVE